MSRTRPDGAQDTRRARILLTASAALAITLVAGCKHSEPAAAAGGATDATTAHPAPVKISAETVFQFRLPRGIPTGS